MKVLFLAICLLLNPLSLDAKIIEISLMHQMLDYLTPQTLVILDIDNTIMEPVQELGSDQWFYHRIQEYQQWGLSKEDALEKALREWTAIQSITQVKLVECGIDQIIARLQSQGFTVMGLSTRGLGISTRTVEQLETLHVDLIKTAPTKEEVYFMNPPHGVLFRGGILFTAGTDKGAALKKFLSMISYKPEKVLFVNDKRSHLLPLEEACASLDIPFIGLRYGYTDEKVKNFRKHIADVQLHFFGHIISDDAAERILHENLKVSR